MKGGVASLNLHNVRNVAYIGKLYVGSNRQMIRANFDTGSANPWIFSKQAITDPSTLKVAHPFDPALSHTFKDHTRPENVRVMFGSGAIVGHFVKDTVYIGELNSRNSIELKDFEFGLAVQAPLNGSMFDALIGLGYP